MKRSLLIFLSLLIVFILGCSKEETKQPEITTMTYKSDEIKDDGEVIEEGVETETTEEIVTVRLCHDTDNGMVRWVNGSIFGFYINATRFEFNDYCQNFNYLMEFYCEDEQPKQRIFLCKNGCEDNHCL